MNPLYFGTSDRPLFGVYHPPRTRGGIAHGIVLCYPIGQEYMRAHRAFRQLAILLSKAGFPVLRFDYFGTGDSGGASEAGTLADWIADIGTAIDELKDNAAVQHVSLVGLRLGACLAAQVQLQRSDVTRAVLWDPISHGPDYLAELLATTVLSPEEQHSALQNRDDTIGVNGFPWTPRLRRDVLATSYESFRPAAAGAVGLLVSEEKPDYLRVREQYASLQDRFTYRCIPSPGDWAFVDAYGSALLPQDIIQGIVTYLSEESLS